MIGTKPITKSVSVKPPSHTSGGNAQDASQAVKAVLADFHRAASEADGKRYFDHLAPDGIFLGTDKTERWSIEQFKSFADPYFSNGKGWTAIPTKQNIFLSPDKRTAWFDESLENADYCVTRGTGVMRKREDRWKIVQYNLAFTIPNELVADLIKKISDLTEKK